MRRLRYASKALKDLDAIAEHTTRAWGKRQARKYIAELRIRFRWLTENPYLGQPRDEIRPGLRSFPQGRHLVFYLVQEGEVLIVGVPHNAMNLEAYFGRP